MKKLTQFLMILGCFTICIAVTNNVSAQKKAQNDDEKYLAGAVPEVDGKVVFTKEFSIPGMSADEIYKRTYAWMEARLKKNENTSRIVYTTPEEGLIVGIGDEWIVFKSNALSLDRSRITYQLTATCQPEQCTLEISKIRYIYREGEERYTAEEWITDEYALNKTKTKLVRGLAKWRRKTVDFADNIGTELAEALSAATLQNVPAEETAQTAEEEKSGPTVILPQTQVIEKKQNADKSSYKEIAPEQLPQDVIQPSTGKLVIVIGTDPFNMSMMTANAGGSLGKIEGKNVVFCILSPEQPHEQLDQAETYTVRFYPTGQSEPSILLECKKMPSPQAIEGMPRTYIGEIVKALMK